MLTRPGAAPAGRMNRSGYAARQYAAGYALVFITTGADSALITDSLRVAAVHGKRHDDLLRLIRTRLDEAGEWGLRNFAEGVYYDPRNQQNHPMFTMTKDGYQFLVGRMTGKKATEHQWAFIDAFNSMAAGIEAPSPAVVEGDRAGKA